MTRLEYYIIHSKPIQALFAWLKRVILPGFDGVSLYDSLNFFRKEIFATRFATRANSVSFSFLMAMPPLLLFFFTLIPYLPLPEQKIIATINEMLQLLAPNDKIKDSITAVITDFITHKKSVLLSFSVFLTVFYSSNGMMALMNSFDKQLPGFKKRSGFKRRWYAILLTMQMIIVTIAVFAFLIFQAWIAGKYELEFMRNFVYLKALVILLLTGLTFLTIASIYKYGTATSDKVKLISPGAVIATVLVVMLTALFFYSVNNLVNYNKIYGSVGTLIMFMIWINFMAHIILIGFELNTSIIVNKKMRS